MAKVNTGEDDSSRRIPYLGFVSLGEDPLAVLHSFKTDIMETPSYFVENARSNM